MENDGKYYTPTIEEFYVGFEYEVKKEESWFRCFYSQGSLVDIYYKYNDDLDSIDFKADAIRVKYLDQEDIESLGFKETETKNFFELDNKQESYLNWYPEVNRVEIGDNECSGGFSGTIKNKSELIKLLKQLSTNE